MNHNKIVEFISKRPPSKNLDRVADLVCYGCAHSVANAPPPSHPSGERPCMSCIRNPDKPYESKKSEKFEIMYDNLGHARIFNPYVGAMYNGAPNFFFPMDNYVTLDQRIQEEWLHEHPEYLYGITVSPDTNEIAVIIDDSDKQVST